MMSALPPKDLGIVSDLVSTFDRVAMASETDPPAPKAQEDRRSLAQKDRDHERRLSAEMGKPIGEVRTLLDQRAQALRRKQHEVYRSTFARAPGLVPTFERTDQGQDANREEVVLEEAVTRPVYCSDNHQVEQKVVVPAVTVTVNRMVPPIEQMRRRGTISDSWAAYAEKWRATWSLAEAGFRSALASGVGREPGGLPEAIVIAASDLRAAAAAVGKIGHRVLTELVGYEMSIQQMAERHGMNRQEMTGVCKAVLERLAEHYER